MGSKYKPPRDCKVILDYQDHQDNLDALVKCFLFNLAGPNGEFVEHSSVTSRCPTFFINYGERPMAEFVCWNNVSKMLNAGGDIKYQLEVRIQVDNLRIF